MVRDSTDCKCNNKLLQGEQIFYTTIPVTPIDFDRKRALLVVDCPTHIKDMNGGTAFQLVRDKDCPLTPEREKKLFASTRKLAQNNPPVEQKTTRNDYARCVVYQGTCYILHLH